MSPRANPYADFNMATSKGRLDVIQSDNFGLTTTGPAIIIGSKQPPYERLDTFIHEMLHHSLPDALEAEVVRISRDISKLLWSVGYRRVHK